MSEEKSNLFLYFLKNNFPMTGLGPSACRRLKQIKSSRPAKPLPAGGPRGPRFPPSLKMLIGDSMPMGNGPTKAEILETKGNIIFVSFSPSSGKKEEPKQSKIKEPPSIPKEKPEAQTTSSAEQAPSSSHAGMEMVNSVLSSSSTQKGLQNLKKGKYDQLWMVKWLDWYKFVVAMTKKPLGNASSFKIKYFSENVRAETAKIAWSG